MTPDEVNSLRDAAILLENDHIDLAFRLMEMAHRERPDGPFINNRLKQYHVRKQEDLKRVQELVQSGDLAIVASGFRCYTKSSMANALNLKQASLPFDNGFFPPSSIARLLETRQVALKFPDPDHQTHAICTKREKVHQGDKRGIEFRTSSYEDIDALVQNRDQPDINRFLDATFGYYTLDKANGFVLAHYNWHKFADEEKSKGLRHPELNIPNINQMLNSRIERMFDMCNRARKVLFVYGEFQKFDFMSIDNDVHDLRDIKIIQKALSEYVGDHAMVVRFSEVDTASKVLARIE